MVTHFVMKYSELISFNPIEDVIQLKTADDSDKAKEYVKSYVMSDSMAENLKYSVIEQLQFDKLLDNKGVLIVGNYGTGKSHLMSLISAVSNNSALAELIQNKKFADYIKPIAGKFEVLRIEIGGVTMPLRELLIDYIKEDFDKRGIEFEVPDYNKVKDNKRLLASIMEAFASKYQEKGYLIVIDEFLSYLASRDAMQIVADLEFFRQLGEIASKSKLRIICGVQEKIFENPRFSFVSSTLMHVKDRFTQVVISKEATAYVVSERILKKNKEQKSRIKAHLEKFCPLYPGMAQRLDEFVDLFPIHPAYIDIFNKLFLIENRHILKNISETIRNVFNEEVPTDEPGIFSFDNYWKAIKTNSMLKTDNTINTVVTVSTQLEDIINRSFPKAVYKPIAMRIISALSVFRLSTNDLTVQSGLTAENLKDDLCIFTELPEYESDFLLDVVRNTLKTIISTLSGQFIVCNELNNQYYLDINKRVDYDEEIKKRAEVVNQTFLNPAFYDLVYSCLEWDGREYVNGYKIYQYDINWQSHNIYREGYLFLGHPNERSTAQPERDFYIIFMPPYGNESHPINELEDELYLYFNHNEEFDQNLLYYYSAKELALVNEGKDRFNYENKAKNFKDKLLKYLREKRNSCFEIRYNSKTSKITDILYSGRSSSNQNLKDSIDEVASICFEELFSNRYPNFPKMQVTITRKNIDECVKSVFNQIAGKPKNNLSEGILNSFGLISNNRIKPENSSIAKYFIAKLKKLPPKGVINFSEIFEENGTPFPTDTQFKLSNQLLSVVFLALVYGGQAKLTIKNNISIDATKLDELLKFSYDDIINFKYISKPAKMAEAELKQLFDVLELNPSLLDNVSNRDKAAEELYKKTNELCNNAVKNEHKVKTSFNLWGEPLASDSQKEILIKACGEINNEFSNYGKKYNTAAKLANFSLDSEKIDELAEYIKKMNLIPEYMEFKEVCSDVTSYLNQIEEELNDELKERLSRAKETFRNLRESIFEDGSGRQKANQIIGELESIKNDYIVLYYNEHKKNRLNRDESVRKNKIQSSDKFNALRKLSKLEVLSESQINAIEKELSDLKTCYDLDSQFLNANPHCGSCKFKIGDNSKNTVGALDNIEAKIDSLYEEWKEKLLKMLSEEKIKSDIKLLKGKQKQIIKDFIDDQKFPEKIDDYFINALTSVFKGFELITIDFSDLVHKLEQLSPMEIQDLNKVINNYISQEIGRKDPTNLRITVINT